MVILIMVLTEELTVNTLIGTNDRNIEGKGGDLG